MGRGTLIRKGRLWIRGKLGDLDHGEKEKGLWMQGRGSSPSERTGLGHRTRQRKRAEKRNRRGNENREARNHTRLPEGHLLVGRQVKDRVRGDGLCGALQSAD